MVAGDTVYVTAGTYNERVLPQNSGNSTSGYIGYVGWEEGVIIDGTGLGWNGIYANGKSYLRFERLQIANCHSDGIVIEYGDHIEIIDCTVEGNGKGNQSWDHGVELGRVTNFVIVNCDLVDNFSSGVSLYECEYGLVANCRAHDNNGDKAFGGYCDDSDGIAGNNCRHLIVENCEASYNGEDGIDFAMYKGFSGDCEDIVVRDCRAHHNPRSGLAISGEIDPEYPYQAHNIRWIRCQSYRNRDFGWVGYEKAYNLRLVNCTIAHNGDLGIHDGWPRRGNVAHDIKIKNGISAFNTAQNLTHDGPGPLVLDYNGWWGAKHPPDCCGDHHVEADPAFVDAAKDDYHLASSSPFRDAGGPVTVTTSMGSGTTIQVSDSGYFTDGMGLTSGDTIRIGSAEVSVVDIPSATTIVVDTSVSWESGTGVYFPYEGSAPDLGALETETLVREKPSISVLPEH